MLKYKFLLLVIIFAVIAPMVPFALSESTTPTSQPVLKAEPKLTNPGEKTYSRRILKKPANATTRPIKFKSRKRKLTSAQEAETLGYLKEQRPGYHSRILELRKTHPVRYRHTLGRIYPSMKAWKAMPSGLRTANEYVRETQVAIVEMVRTMKLVRDPKEKTGLEKELQERVKTHFEAEQKLRELRLANLEKRIQDLRQELQEQRIKQDQIITERMKIWKEVVGPAQPSAEPVPQKADESSKK